MVGRLPEMTADAKPGTRKKSPKVPYSHSLLHRFHPKP